MYKDLVVIKGAGDLATGVAHRLFHCGFPILMLEIPNPTVIRRTVAFAEAIYSQENTVEGVTAVSVQNFDEIEKVISLNKIPILVDPDWKSIEKLKPAVVVDAILAKRNLGTSLTDSQVVIGLGPGFTAGKDVHAVVETQRGHYLGKVIYFGTAIPDTGVPGNIGGYSKERLIRSPIDGIFKEERQIGDILNAGDIVARVNNVPVYAPISGVIRGLLHNDLIVSKGSKIGDIDPRGIYEHIFDISDKARAISGGVLEAILTITLKREDKKWIPFSKMR
jgi:xanthine dehydrogenase accessory factor